MRGNNYWNWSQLNKKNLTFLSEQVSTARTFKERTTKIKLKIKIKTNHGARSWNNKIWHRKSLIGVCSNKNC